MGNKTKILSNDLDQAPKVWEEYKNRLESMSRQIAKAFDKPNVVTSEKQKEYDADPKWFYEKNLSQSDYTILNTLCNENFKRIGDYSWKIDVKSWNLPQFTFDRSDINPRRNVVGEVVWLSINFKGTSNAEFFIPAEDQIKIIHILNQLSIKNIKWRYWSEEMYFGGKAIFDKDFNALEYINWGLSFYCLEDRQEQAEKQAIEVANRINNGKLKVTWDVQFAHYWLGLSRIPWSICCFSDNHKDVEAEVITWNIHTAGDVNFKNLKEAWWDIKFYLKHNGDWSRTMPNMGNLESVHWDFRNLDEPNGFYISTIAGIEKLKYIWWNLLLYRTSRELEQDIKNRINTWNLIVKGNIIMNGNVWRYADWKLKTCNSVYDLVVE